MGFHRNIHLPLTLALVAAPAALVAQKAGAEWLALKKVTDDHYAKGQYSLALEPASKALALAEKKAGPLHPDTATSLEDLALILVEQSKLAEAEPLHLRALAIREKTLGLDHPDVAASLGNLGTLYRAQGQYAKAEPFYVRSLALQEKSRGPEHPDVALALNNLGLLYKDQGQWKKAEPLYLRASTIWEKARGPNHPDVATALTNLADLKSDQGQEAEAEEYFKRALAIVEKALGPDHIRVARSLNNLAVTYENEGKYALAEPLKVRALAIKEKVLGPDHPNVALGLSGLAYVHQVQGRYDQAQPLYERALAIVEKAFGPDHHEVAYQLGRLAGFFEDQGKFSRSEPLKVRALAIQEKALGVDHPKVALALHGLAFSYRTQGRFVEAEPLFKRAIAIWEKAYGPEHSQVGTAVGNLAQLYNSQGRFALAEPLYRRALAINEKALGLDHPDLGPDLNNLAYFLETQGGFDQAEPLYLRAISIVEKNFGKEHRHVGSLTNNLAFLHYRQGHFEQAEQLFLRANAIWEKVLGPEHPEMAVSLNNLGGLYSDMKQYDKAEPFLLRALATKEKAFGRENIEVAQVLNNLARVHARQGRYPTAEGEYQRTVSIWETSLGSDHPSLAITLLNFAELHELQGHTAEALRIVRRVSGIYRGRISGSGIEAVSNQEAARNRDGFFKHLALLSLNPSQEPTPRVTDESFQVGQFAQATEAGAAVAKMAARFARGDDPIAGLVRRKQDALELRAKTQARLLRASGLSPDKRKPHEEQKQREEILRLGREIDSVDAELNARYPEYQMLTQPDPLDVKQVQRLLQPGEALLVFQVGKDQSWMWVVQPGGANFLPLAVKGEALARAVKSLRTKLEIDSVGRPQPMDLAAAHGLYRDLFAPAARYLAGVRHVLVVPSGPLQALPFAMLVAAPPKAVRSEADYRKVDWLMRHYALSVLPSVGSLRALRLFAKPTRAQEPFIGFGDPLLNEKPGTTRSARATLRLTGLFRTAPATAESALPLDVADVEVIRQQDPLPESGEEIRAMARITKAGPESVWLQEKATEKNVKTLDLARYRILAFATHGVMANELGTGLEPGLLLTPPGKGTLEDDGYLAAGEIARLKLNADWVLLSACNTAAPDGSPGAEGLSGLAKAFFYAGSRSLLVSHWPVASEATVALTTTMLREYEARPGNGKAAAHRQAMLQLLNSPGHPEYAHPLFWAPFVVVGDGGPQTRNPSPFHR